MNKNWFRFVVVLMSIALLGIVVVQGYLINVSFKNKEEQFKYQVKQVIDNVAREVEEQEAYTFLSRFSKIKDSIGKEPERSELMKFFYVEKNELTNQTIIYSNSIIPEDYSVSSSFFDKNNDSTRIKNYVAKRVTEVYNETTLNDQKMSSVVYPSERIEKAGVVEILDKATFELNFKDIAATRQVSQRVSVEQLQVLFANELKALGINTPFEFGIYNNGLATKVKSEHFKYDKKNTYDTPLFTDNDGISRYQLLLSFPKKKVFLASDFVGIAFLAFLFTSIIIVAYYSALKQLNTQRHISEIKTDFINNMTHEFKTPIATINLALDAIRNPKVIDDKEKVQRYLQMIKDENKRMHAQVENVLRISKLERKELDITKECHDVHDMLEEAIEHVSLIVEDRQGEMKTDFKALKSKALLNDIHFTNVLVNVLENAVKYTPEKPVINISTENVKNFIVIKIKDNGIGIGKVAQKKIFDKFYREHTGDIHNVKGHGLGLAYVKRIMDDHHGEVVVESEKGKGSTFIIKLPLIV
ncbi:MULTISPECIES: sensor histidine kinase [Flavobacterium]|uniref:histidine kinase n=1 Tax=Flavobacterium columnare TaxID=996 RepID=A0AA94JNY3_9FLAO|nr:MULTISPECIES: HAMP domain-containing sensor histidine kinase [Flavobacterium]OXA73560.1 sensor histidine kinase [Flavobacterium columnare] [Flavobacterium columnare NBRC 100251 = ATCC 23463]AMA48587.1 histidine kinase [Flavobacterium covae]AND65287.1 two-component sensor histidine kinase [Flavobacterium covae]MCH4830539.1 HAMP domain-containing histidine kinase [Flavobacterium columnare]MCH4833523.1 HAMP domain-containing histidine kinase [Flavobacterium columnare]